MQVRYRAALRPELQKQNGEDFYFKKNYINIYTFCVPPASSGMRYRAALRPEQIRVANVRLNKETPIVFQCIKVGINYGINFYFDFL